MPILGGGVASLFNTGYTEDNATGQMSSLSLSLGDTPHLAAAVAVLHFQSHSHSLSFSFSLSPFLTADEKSWHFDHRINLCLGATATTEYTLNENVGAQRESPEKMSPEKMSTKLKPSSLRVRASDRGNSIWSECTQSFAYLQLIQECL